MHTQDFDQSNICLVISLSWANLAFQQYILPGQIRETDMTMSPLFDRLSLGSGLNMFLSHIRACLVCALNHWMNIRTFADEVREYCSISICAM